MGDIRLATSADVREVLALWTRADAAPTVTDDEPSLAEMVRRAQLLVAEDAGRLVGSLIATFDGWRGGMYRLAVDPEYRRRGIGRRLVAAAEQRLAGEGCVRITALVLREEAHATAFWAAVGYAEQESSARYVKALEP